MSDNGDFDFDEYRNSDEFKEVFYQMIEHQAHMAQEVIPSEEQKFMEQVAEHLSDDKELVGNMHQVLFLMTMCPEEMYPSLLMSFGCMCYMKAKAEQVEEDVLDDLFSDYGNRMNGDDDASED